MEITYSGPPSGKGASDAWDGGHAKGSIEITDAVPVSSVTMLLHMQKPLEAQYGQYRKGHRRGRQHGQDDWRRVR